MGMWPGADGRTDRRQVDPVRAEWCQQQRGKAGGRNQWRGRHLVAIGAQHGHAGHVLRGHGHHEQRDADADGGGQREARRGPHRGGHLQLETAEVQQAQGTGQRSADQQCGQHAVTGRQALDQQVAEEHAQHQQRAVLRGDEDLAADLEQDAGQQGRRQRGGDAFDQALEAAGQAADEHQHRTGDVGADRLGVADPAQAGDQQRRARCRPGDGDGRAVAQRQADAAHRHADRQGPDPGGDLRAGQARRLAGLEHQHQRAGVAGEHGDEAGDHRRRGAVCQGPQACGGGIGHGRGPCPCVSSFFRLTRACLTLVIQRALLLAVQSRTIGP